jgi:antirestriction protein
MAKIYVGTYEKYNNGSIQGKWLDLLDYPDKEDFLEACEEVHSDEEYPEFMFQDWEGIPSRFIGESWISEEVWDYLTSGIEDGVREAYMFLFNKWDSEECEDLYEGEFSSWENFAEHIVEEEGLLEGMPEVIQSHFCCESYGRDLKLSGDYSEHEGHYFHSN